MLNKNKIKLGIAPINWSNDDLPELGGDISFEECIAEIKKAGYVGTEIGHKFPTDPQLLLEKLKPFGLSIASQWTSVYFTDPSNLEGNSGERIGVKNPDSLYQKSIDEFKKRIRFLKAVGAEIVVISEQSRSIQGDINKPLFKNKPILTDNQWELLFTGLEEIGKIANENNMKIAYHHHMGTVIQTFEETAKLMDNTDPELVHLLLDTGHIYYSDENAGLFALIKNYGDRIVHIHLKDIRANIRRKVMEEELSFLQGVKLGVFTVPGDGTIDFIKVFEEIEKLDYEGWMIVEAEQDPKKANPLEFAIKSRNFIKEITGL
ncbi:MAG: myo-inosose-2 dehydratase [Promethearchaeota archaeon]